eukprot:1610948-Amphidinium_carterae.1
MEVDALTKGKDWKKGGKDGNKCKKGKDSKKGSKGNDEYTGKGKVLHPLLVIVAFAANGDIASVIAGTTLLKERAENRVQQVVGKVRRAHRQKRL